MKAVRFYGQNDIRLDDNLPIPQITTPDEVLVEVSWCGICGSDLTEIKQGPIFFAADEDTNKVTGKKAPLLLGHEMSGVVKEVGANVTHVKPGDKVVIEPTLSCKDSANYGNEDFQWCAACNAGLSNICEYLGLCGLGAENGGMAEFVVYGKEHILKLPDDLALDVAALVQPLAVSWHAMEVGRFQKGQSLLIIGAGPIGLGLILCLQAKGAGKIVCSEPLEIRRNQAASLGSEVCDPTGMEPSDFLKLSTDGQGFDTTFDCSGFPVTYRTSIEALRPRGIAVNVAVWPHKPVQHYVMDLTYHEKLATGSMCYTIEDFKKVVECIENKSFDLAKLASMITSKVLLKDAQEKALDELLYNKEKHIKILITPKDLDHK